MYQNMLAVHHFEIICIYMCIFLHVYTARFAFSSSHDASQWIHC